MSRPKKAAPAYNGEMWEQMIGESTQQYERFCLYRDMRYKPPDKEKDPPKLDLTSRRSIRGVAERLGMGPPDAGELELCLPLAGAVRSIRRLYPRAAA